MNIKTIPPNAKYILMRDCALLKEKQGRLPGGKTGATPFFPEGKMGSCTGFSGQQDGSCTGFSGP